MPSAVWVSLVVAALVTVAALVWTVRRLLGRLRQLGSDLDRLQRDLTPALRQLEVDAGVTSVELAALGDRLEARSAARAARPRRRWRPRPAAPGR